MANQHRCERLCVVVGGIVALLMLVEMSPLTYKCSNPHRDMETLSQAIELYRLHHQRLPESMALRCAGPDREHGTLDDLYEFGPDL